MRLFACTLPLLLTLGATAVRADPVRLDLNAVNPRDGGCQLVFVAQNDSGVDVTALTLEAVLFDTAGRVASLTLLDMQDLPAGRMRVRAFDIGGLACADIGRVLINGVSACEPSGGPGCTDALEVTSHTPIEVLE